MGTAPRFSVTRHGRIRVAQRGIDPEALELLLRWGQDLPAGCGCVRRVLLLKDAIELFAEGIGLGLIETATRVEAVVAEDGRLVTAYARAPQELRCLRRRSIRRRTRRRS